MHCIVCETVVRSENVWSVHLNSKNHKQNILSKVKKKEPPKDNFKEPKPIALKRPTPPTPLTPTPPKKLKSILKNPTPVSFNIKNNENSIQLSKTVSEPSVIEESTTEGGSESINPETNLEEDDTNYDVLPEGFFDDPKLDAKVRNEKLT